MLTLVQAHTHGVNWELFLAIFGAVSTVIGGVYKLISAKLAEQDLKKEGFQRTVTNQHNELGGEVRGMRGELVDVRERVARLEGRTGYSPPARPGRLDGTRQKGQ